MKLHYETRGDGPPVLILHGLFGSHQNWLPVARELSGTFRVLTVDLRNHGQSPHHDESSYAVMAEDVARLIDDLDLGKVSLLGHSLGGKVAMQVALSHPEVVERLVIVDIGPRAYVSLHDDVFAALSHLDLAGIHSRSQADELLSATIPHRPTRHFLLTNLMRAPEGRWRWRMNLETLHAHREHLAGSLHGAPFPGPTLFIRGALSSYLAENDLNAIRNLFPRATLHTIAEAGHWVQVDAPGPFIAAVRQFLTAAAAE